MTAPREAGSPGAPDRADVRRWREALRAASRDREALTALLDPLARAAAEGSPTALETLVWAVDELRLARPSIRRLLVAEADIDEVAQDVLVAVAETIHGYRGDARFTTWLHQVARYKAIAHLRRRQPTLRLADADADAGVGGGGGAGARRARGGGGGRPGGDPGADAGEGGPFVVEPVGDAQRISSMIATRASIGAIVRSLPDHYREAVVLRDIEHLAYNELAERLGLNLNTAKARVARGRALVAARLTGR